MFLIPRQLVAQDSTVQAKKWAYRVEPYLMFPNMKGSTGIAGLPLVDVDASSSDIFSKLKMGAMLNLEANNGTWAINSDFLYMNLEQDLKASTVISSGKVNAKQMGWEIAVFRRLAPWIEIGVGGLINGVQIDLVINQNQIGGGTVNKTGSQKKTWIDPMLIARLTTPGTGIPKKFFGLLRGEYGGFGVGSDIAWQVQAVAGYRFSKLFDMSLGYRAIGLDYKSGDGSKAFIYDIVTSGPMLRFGFNF